MKRILLVSLAMIISACGYSSVNNELIGQARTVIHWTPWYCEDHADAYIRLDVLHNGPIEAMSTQAALLTVPNASDLTLLEAAAKAGKIVTVKYRVARVNFCWEDYVVESAWLAK